MLDPRVETFLTVCETMNFTKAASLLHITQPAVSQQVRALEEQYGTKLFRYKSRQLFLTEEGALFLRTARTMRQDAIRLQESLRQMGRERLLRFGATLTIGEYSMPGPLLRLLQKEPELRLRMLAANTQELLSLLDRGEIDFAIVEGNFDRSSYDSLVYSTQRYIPVAAPGYAFARPVHRLEDLLEERLLVREPGSGTRSILERVLEANNLSVESFRRWTELGSLNLIKSLVEAGAGVSFFISQWYKGSWSPDCCGKSPWRTAPSTTILPFSGSGEAYSRKNSAGFFSFCGRGEHACPSSRIPPRGDFRGISVSYSL